MNIALINVSLRPESKLKLFPIGLGYIATAMHQAGFDFDFIDIDACRYTDQEVDALLKKKSYDVVCMGCIVTGYKFVKDLCRRARTFHPNAFIVVGNSVATSIYEILLCKTEADIAVMGEGDITIVDILHAIQGEKSLAEVPGICYKKNGQVYKNAPRQPIENISELPFIDFSLFDIETYIGNSPEQVNEGMPLKREDVRALPINTARGCVANCTFCYHNFRGYKYRYRSIASIMDEIRDMIKKYQLNYILLGDELTLFSRQRAEEFADAILAQKLNFYWVGTCRADCFTRDSDLHIMKKMKAAGCVGMGYSLESSDEKILQAMNKHIQVAQFVKTTELFLQAGITPTTSLVIGYPQETVETIKKTLACCAENKIYPSAGYLLPQPGSVMYTYAKEHGYILDEEDYLLKMGDRQDLRINMTQMSDEEMEQAVKEGLEECNDRLGIGLCVENLIKTQYYRAAKK